jgi:hypothetical protein
MLNEGNRLCRDCKHCLRIPEMDSYSLFCDNLLTKEFQYPKGFLARDAKECRYFEAPCEADLAVIAQNPQSFIAPGRSLTQAWRK